MRTFSHWTPRYIKNRIVTFHYEKTHPGDPWLTRSANEILDSLLKKTDVGLEFGSGRSTMWFARRVASLTSVEHNESWSLKIQKMLAAADIKNVRYRFLPQEAEGSDSRHAKYVKIIDEFENNSLDFCLIDGVYRDSCALRVIDKMRCGGVLVIDNVNWYLPSRSHSPDSRDLADGPSGPIWKEVETLVSSWRRIWTSSGVSDTALFFKPC